MRTDNTVTFIHTSAEDDKAVYTPLIPIGMVGLASFLDRNYILSEILNVELERILNPDFDLAVYLIENKRTVFCLNLHWHSQSVKVMELCRLLKEAIPCSRIILGGFTASYYAAEIMASFPEIDFIITGESEQPLLDLLVRIFSGNKDFHLVANLFFREGGAVLSSRLTYNTTQKIIDAMEFANFKFLKNYDYYLRVEDPLNKADGLLSNVPATFYYNCGRGCLVNCSFCGGSRVAQKIINHRSEIIFISQGAVVRELKRASHEYGITRWHTCFDPLPKGDYYIELFRKIRAEGLKLNLGFECWALPSRQFIDEFAMTFDLCSSVLEISPECGSQRVRRKNKGYYYSNTELLDTLKYVFLRDIKVRVFFTAGLASETRDDIKETLKLIKLLRMQFKQINIKACCIEMEPCSPWNLDAEEYGITTDRRKFSDFLRAHQTGPSLGYRTNEFTGEDIEQIVAFYNSYNKTFDAKVRNYSCCL